MSSVYEKDRLDIAISNINSQFGSGQKGIFGYNFQIVAVFFLVAVGFVCIVNAIVSRSYSAVKLNKKPPSPRTSTTTTASALPIRT